MNIEADVLTLSVNQTNISSLGNGQKEAKISISFIGWWEDSDVSEPGPVVGYIDASTLRFTSSTTLDIFTSPFVDVDYRVQGAGMSGDEADLTQGIMWMMMNSLCCLGLFIIPLAGSLKMKDKPFAISQFLTMIPFIFIGWIGLASSGM